MNPIFDELPTKLGLYTLTELLCSRERSELYAATQSYVDRAVVIEVLRPGCSESDVEHFRASARKRASVSLAHVSPVLEAVQTDGFSYVVQEKPAGESLSTLLRSGFNLSYKQGMTLIEAVAELYSACADRNMAALPLDTASIYMKVGGFSFLSPLEEGESDAAAHEAQMAALADILEQAVSSDVLSGSNLAVVVHWLRCGYSGGALEWRPLRGALNSFRLQKRARHESGDQRKSKSLLRYTKRRYMKRALRALLGDKKLIIFSALGVLAVAVITAALRFFLYGPVPLPAVTEDYVYCLYGGEKWRVHSNPVSVREYSSFLSAFNSMSFAEKERLHADMPDAVASHTPLDWDRQRKGSPDSPVCGVSYWDALAYARYRRESIPDASLVQTARQCVPLSASTDEWTSTRIPEHFPLASYYVVIPADGSNPIPVMDPDCQEKQRGFRTARIKKNKLPPMQK